jgi:hypothetical protein
MNNRGIGVQFLEGPRDFFSLLQSAIQWVPGADFRRVKRRSFEADHSPLFNAEIKNYIATFHMLQAVILN